MLLEIFWGYKVILVFLRGYRIWIRRCLLLCVRILFLGICGSLVVLLDGWSSGIFCLLLLGSSIRWEVCSILRSWCIRLFWFLILVEVRLVFFWFLLTMCFCSPTPTPGIEPGSPEGPGLAIRCNTIMRCRHGFLCGGSLIKLLWIVVL